MCRQTCLILAICIVAVAGSGCMSTLDPTIEKKITVIDPVKSPPFEVDAICKEFFEAGLIQDPKIFTKVDPYKDQWTYYLPKTVTAIIDTSGSMDTISMDLTLVADSSNPTRQTLRTEYVTSFHIRLVKMVADSSHSLIFGPENGEGSLVVTKGQSQPEIIHRGNIIVEFHDVEKINKGKNSKLTMEIQAKVDSKGGFPNFSFNGAIEFQW